MLETLVDGLAFGEGPRWHNDRLWFSDMHSQCVMTAELSGKTEVICHVEGDPSGLGWLPDGRLLIVSMRDRRVLRLDQAGLMEHADLSQLASWYCNDMVVDAQGRAYVGNFGFDLHNNAKRRPAELVLVEPNGAARVVCDDVIFPNGSVITPDGSTLIVGETFGGGLTAFDIQPDGSLENKREWAAIKGAAADGICLDAEGAIWVASPVSAEVLRVHEGGDVSQRVKVETQAYACMLGGPDRKTLFVLTSGSSLPEECKAKRDAKIEITQVDVPGAGLP
jgi:sugar lactone lactonase YvrE